MRGQPGRSPEEGAILPAADDRSRTFISGRCCGRRRWGRSLFAASAGSSTLSSLSPPSPSSDGTRASEFGTAFPHATIQLSGLVALGPGYLRLSPLSGGGPNPKGLRDEEPAASVVVASSASLGELLGSGTPAVPFRDLPSCESTSVSELDPVTLNRVLGLAAGTGTFSTCRGRGTAPVRLRRVECVETWRRC